MKVLEKPLTLPEIKKKTKNGKEYITGVVSVDIGVMTANDYESFLDELAMNLTNSDLLMDISYEVVGGKGSSVYLKVSGDVSQVLEQEN